MDLACLGRHFCTSILNACCFSMGETRHTRETSQVGILSVPVGEAGRCNELLLEQTMDRECAEGFGEDSERDGKR